MSLRAYLDSVLSDSAPRGTVSGGRAIGVLGWNIPVELILAANAVPVQLGTALMRDTALADRFLESSFSAGSRAVAQQWLSGQLDTLAAVVFSRSDDSAQRLYYYLCELQRIGECKGPKPLLYDVAGIARSTSMAYTVESTKLLAAALDTQESNLPAATQRVATRAALVDAFSKLRAASSVPLGSLAHRTLRASRLDWSEEFEPALQSWLAAPETIEPRRRILLVGSALADEQLHLALEAEGAVIVGEIDEVSGAANGEASAASLATESFEAVAQRAYQQTRSARSLLQSPADIVKTADALRVDAVIGWMLATDTGLAWVAARIEKAVRDANLPVLILTSQPDSLTSTSLAQATQFVRTLEAR